MMNRMKKRICMFMLFVLGFSVAGANKVHAEDLSLYARSALLMDASSGRVLYEENGFRVMPMASTTKIMTCILALEWIEEQKGRRTDVVSVSGYASRMPKVRLGMRKGEQYRMEDLLYSLMLESHNDTAVAIAEHIDGSVEKFAERMNRKAELLGCQNTNFITPNGLDAKEKGRAHTTTAYDLALISSYAIRSERFLEIINTRNYSFAEITTGRQFRLTNKNRFLDMMEGAVGIKTGFTGGAGYCFVGAVVRDGKKLVSVVLGSGWPPNKNWKWSDTKTLMQYGIDKYESKDMEKKFCYKPLKVKNGVSGEVEIKAAEKQKGELVLLLCREDEVSVRKHLKDCLEAPVEKGEIVGYECYYVNNKLYKKYEIRTAESVELRTYFYCLYQVFMLYF